jgi:hypothetical protein
MISGVYIAIVYGHRLPSDWDYLFETDLTEWLSLPSPEDGNIFSFRNVLFFCVL